MPQKGIFLFALNTWTISSNNARMSELELDDGCYLISLSKYRIRFRITLPGFEFPILGFNPILIIRKKKKDFYSKEGITLTITGVIK